MDGSTFVLQVGCFGEQKWRTGESTCLPPLLHVCGLSLLLVLSPAPRGFSSDTPVFLITQKKHTSEFQFDVECTDMQ